MPPSNYELEQRVGAVEQRVDAIELRMTELEESLDRLATRIEQAIGRLIALSQAITAEEPAEVSSSAAAQAAAAPASQAAPQLVVSKELAQVIRYVQEGRGDDAQRLLRSIPEKQLLEQPSVVALVAAALCVQRGDYASGLRALERARSLTEDPRLLRIMQLVEAQMD